MRRLLLTTALLPFLTWGADLDGNGRINEADAAVLHGFLLGLNTDSDAEEPAGYSEQLSVMSTWNGDRLAAVLSGIKGRQERLSSLTYTLERASRPHFCIWVD